MNDKFGWCFLGAGSIVKRVMPEMHITKGGYLASIYAPTFENADKIAKEYNAKAYKTAEEAISDPNVRAVYIAAPHPFHMDLTLLALDMGKPVLCEKPFAINLEQAKKMINKAKSTNTYLMEGMWTRLNPRFRKVLEWINDGRIGKVRYFSANMGFRLDVNPALRMFDPKRAGGAILDIGIYSIAASQFIFGKKPDKIVALGELSSSGVDRICSVNLSYKDSGVAHLFISSATHTGFDAVAYGQKGRIFIPNFAAPHFAELIIDDTSEVYKPDIYNEGFSYEFDAAMDDIREGRLENELIPHKFTIEAMEIMDEIRRQIGLSFPMDR